MPTTSSRIGHLWHALARGYAVLGLEKAAGGDEVFRGLVLARIIEPASRLDSGRALEEAGATPASYPTVCPPSRRARTIWQYWHTPALSGLLPPSTPPRGSGCHQLHRPAAT